MDHYIDFLAKHRKAVIALFLLAACLCCFLSQLEETEYGVTGYLPRKADSVTALRVMEEEYGYGLANLQVMLQEVSVPEALDRKREMEALSGVARVEWLDDVINLYEPLEMADQKEVERWYLDGKACIRITVKEGMEAETLEEIRRIAGTGAALSGSAARKAAFETETPAGMGMLPVFLVLLLLLGLFVTGSWVEPVLLAFTVGIALLLNRGLALFLGRLSFVTRGAVPLLVLSVAGGCGAALLYRTATYREEGMEGAEAMKEGWRRLAGGLSVSILCTAACALVFASMEYGLGPELGRAMALACCVCLGSVLCLLPCLVFVCDGLIRRTGHRLFAPGRGILAKGIIKLRVVLLLLAAVAFPVLFLAQRSNVFYYGEGEIYDGTENRLGRDTAAIREAFGSAQTLVLLVPKGEAEKESAMDAQLEGLDYVSGVISYPAVVGNAIPDAYSDSETRSRFYSAHYSLHSVLADVGEKEADWEERLLSILNVGEKYYGDRLQFAGEAVICQEQRRLAQEGTVERNLLAGLLLCAVVLLWFRRISFPVLFLLPWIFAGWLNEGIFYLEGEKLFYAGYLAAGMLTAGVGMGYLLFYGDCYAACEKILPKREAAIEACRMCIPIFLISAALPAAAGFLLYRFSENGMMRQMGRMAGRGFLAMAAATLLLLSGLLLFGSGFPEPKGRKQKTRERWKRRKGADMKKNQIGKYTAKGIALMLSAALILGGGVARAAGEAPVKEENIYARLSQDGGLEELYVVNTYRLEEEADITDYGKYDSVKNLTSGEEIQTKGDRVSFHASAGQFSYQGNLKTKELPWEISISYELNGKKMQAEELAGKNGALKIRIHVGENDRASGDFFDHYMLRVRVPLDMERCSNVQAAGATVENEGSRKSLIFDILSGREKDIVITTDILDFEMGEIIFQGFPMALDVDRDTFSMEDLYEKSDELTDAADEFDDGAKELSDGTDALREGADGLRDGVESLRDGLKSYADGTKTLNDGVEELSDGTMELADGMEELHDGVNELRDGVNGENGAASGARKLAEGVGKLEEGAKQLSEGVSALIAMIKGSSAELDETGKGLLETAERMSGQLQLLQIPGFSTNPDLSVQGNLEALSQYLEGIIKAVLTLGGPSGIPEEEDGPTEKEKPSLPDEEEKQKEDEDTDPEDGSAQTDEKDGEIDGTDTDGEADTDGEMDTDGETDIDGEADTDGETDAGNETDTDDGTDIDDGTGTGGETGTDDEIDTDGGTNTSNGTETAEDNKSGGGSGLGEEDKPATGDASDTNTGSDAKGASEKTDKTEKGNDSGNIPTRGSGDGSGNAAGNGMMGRAKETADNWLETAYGADGIWKEAQEPDIRKGRERPSSTQEGAITSLSWRNPGLDSDVLCLSETGGNYGSQAVPDGSMPGPGGSGGYFPDPQEIVSQLFQMKSGVDKLLGCYEVMGKFSSPSNLEQLSKLEEGASALSGGISELADGVDSLASGLEELGSGASKLADGSGELMDGTRELADGVSDLADGTRELTDASDDLLDGTDQLADGTAELSDGARELLDGMGELQDGTGEFRENSGDMETRLDEEIDRIVTDLTGSGYEPKSFLSDKNTNVELVLFSMKTEGIRIPERGTVENTQEKLSFWQRLLRLFGIEA